MIRTEADNNSSMQQPRRIVELDSVKPNPVAALMGLPSSGAAMEYN